MTSLFSYLSDSLKVTPVDDDHLEVSVTLPSEHFHSYLQLLNALTGFAHIINKHARLNRLKNDERSKALAEQAQQRLTHHYERLVELYDRYTIQEFGRTDAIKRISAELRKEHHPWSSIDLVRHALVCAGRPGRVGRSRKLS